MWKLAAPVLRKKISAASGTGNRSYRPTPIDATCMRVLSQTRSARKHRLGRSEIRELHRREVADADARQVPRGAESRERSTDHRGGRVIAGGHRARTGCTHAAKDAWGQASATERAEGRNAVADTIENDKEMLAFAESWENGKPVRRKLSFRQLSPACATPVPSDGG